MDCPPEFVLQTKNNNNNNNKSSTVALQLQKCLSKSFWYSFKIRNSTCIHLYLLSWKNKKAWSCLLLSRFSSLHKTLILHSISSTSHPASLPSYHLCNVGSCSCCQIRVLTKNAGVGHLSSLHCIHGFLQNMVLAYVKLFFFWLMFSLRVSSDAAVCIAVVCCGAIWVVVKAIFEDFRLLGWSFSWVQTANFDARACLHSCTDFVLQVWWCSGPGVSSSMCWRLVGVYRFRRFAGAL